MKYIGKSFNKKIKKDEEPKKSEAEKAEDKKDEEPKKK